ncbi:hypothetical protein D9M68_810100 [compost metagenome]
MSNDKPENANDLDNPQRRDILRAAGAVTIGGIAASSLGLGSLALAQSSTGSATSGSALGGVSEVFSISVSRCRTWIVRSSSTLRFLVARK